MIIKSAEFITSAVKASQYPEENLPEIAFAGRSNVGKSSLINTLVNRKKLVKTSSKPGKTRLINFFNINDQLIFVDLPGYGYAKVSKAVRKTWGPMIESYLASRQILKAVVILMDIRRKPGNEERELMDWLTYRGIRFLPVLTKADKFSRSRQIRQQETIANTIGLQKDQLIRFSAKSRQGKDALWNKLKEFGDLA